MIPIRREDVLKALSGIAAPGMAENIVARGLVSEIIVNGSDVMFAIMAEPAHTTAMEVTRRAAEEAVKTLPGVGKVIVALTAERPMPKPPTTAQSARQARGTAVEGVSHIIAVASGKGGVGKSTTAVNIALGLAALDLRIGILDADIYGPSMPKLMGIVDKPKLVSPGSKMLAPLERFGVKAMSMGFLVDEAAPMIWRGPMVIGALVQMLREVAWGQLDCLVVDMPPGTGDVQLTLAQQTPLSGAVIVSTPQDLALIDARKGLNMFNKVNVPVLGIIENMSYFICSNCGERHEIFGHGGARIEAARLGVPFLGEVPLDAHLRDRSDSGEPVAACEPASPLAAIYRNIASQIWNVLSSPESAVKPPPRIVIER
ncbi:MAG TPA: Mrp/NBP35 family ATP-binding protein [Aestuariivirgaceae bacterium]|nr:Mrp/NBP35 family ATP-binding protein [Aestuariivirgaceae bacterium]